MPAGEYLKAGDPLVIRAAVWNQFVDAKDVVLNSARRQSTGVKPVSWSDFVLCKNTSASNIADLTAVYIDQASPPQDPSASADQLQAMRTSPVMNCVPAQTLGTDWNKGVPAGVALTPIKAGASGWVQVSGACLLKSVTLQDDYDDLVVMDANNSLCSAAYGHRGWRILLKPASDNTPIVVVELSQSRSRYCSKLRGIVSSFDSNAGTATIMNLVGFDGDVKYTDTTVDAVDVFSWGSDFINVNAVAMCFYNIDSEQWEIVQVSCPPESSGDSTTGDSTTGDGTTGGGTTGDP
jgi:hypothetical protein